MTSTTIDSVELSEKYTTKSGSKKSRTTTIKSMSNEGSLFLNIHSGRGSVCISKDMVPKVVDAMKSIGWKTGRASMTIDDLQKEIRALQKQLKSKK